MSRIYTAYNLKPPPPPTAFSLSRSPQTRARFPDFEDPSYRNLDGSIPSSPAEALRDFMAALYDHHYPEEMFIQCRIVGALICVLIVVAGAILLRRLYQGSLWIVRIVRSPRGSLLVPNSLVCFSLSEGMFGCCLVACMFMWPRWYSHEEPRAPETLLCWVLYLWAPLIAGAFGAAWGITHATPSAPNDSASRSKRQMRARVSPIVINFLSLGSPFFVLFAVTGAAVPATVNYVRSQRDFRLWQGAYTSDTNLSQAMLQSAQDIWTHQLRGAYFAAIGFCLWTISALSVTVLYGWAGMRLILTVRRQIRALRDSRSEPSVPDDSNAGTILHARKLTDSQEEDLGEDGCDVKRQEVDQMATFFPPVKPSAMRTIRSMSNTRSGRRAPRVEHQTRFLEKVYSNFLIQWYGIFLAELTFTGLAIYVTACIYNAFEHNQLPRFVQTAILWAGWSSVLFGTITLLAIAQRVYEPLVESFSALNEGKEERGRRRSAANGTLNRRIPDSAKTVDLDATFSQTVGGTDDYAMSKRDSLLSAEQGTRSYRGNRQSFLDSPINHLSTDVKASYREIGPMESQDIKAVDSLETLGSERLTDEVHQTIMSAPVSNRSNIPDMQSTALPLLTPADFARPSFARPDGYEAPFQGLTEGEDRREELGSGVTLTTPSFALVGMPESTRKTLKRPTSASSSLRERNLRERGLVSAFAPLRDALRGMSTEKDRERGSPSPTLAETSTLSQVARPAWSAPEDWGSPEPHDDLLQELQASTTAQTLPPRADSALEQHPRDSDLERRDI